ncbi:MAG: 50S ribosomal protein L18 [Candidatus Krumholzibacteria bacterium]|nr:50S ribosomal protein L18 [Candidatus Krumholzibacteria bacterium]
MGVRKVRLSQRERRHRRVRKKIFGTEARPRLCVFKSAKHIYVQLIDDSQGKTLAAFSSLKLGAIAPGDEVGKKTVAASDVGKHIAEMAKQKGIQSVIFDRGGYRYHGRIAALAKAAREKGLDF